MHPRQHFLWFSCSADMGMCHSSSEYHRWCIPEYSRHKIGVDCGTDVSSASNAAVSNCESDSPLVLLRHRFHYEKMDNYIGKNKKKKIIFKK